MQAALRPYATAGVALVGASVIAVSPVIVTPTAVEVRDTAVGLSALENPIEELAPIFEDFLRNAQAAAGRFADNPVPILEQILANQRGNIANIGNGLEAQIGVISNLPQILNDIAGKELGNLGTAAGLGQTLLDNLAGLFTSGILLEQLQSVVDAAKTGKFQDTFNALFLTGLLLVAGNGLGNLGLLPQLIPVAQQPLTDLQELFPIASGPLHNAEAALGVFQDPTPILVSASGLLFR